MTMRIILHDNNHVSPEILLTNFRDKNITAMLAKNFTEKGFR